MSNTVQVNGQVQIVDAGGAKLTGRQFSFTPTGTKCFGGVQSVGTAAATMAIGSCATLSYVALVNPSTNTATITATCAPIVLKPGYVAVFPPSSALITLQSTAAATDISAAGNES